MRGGVLLSKNSVSIEAHHHKNASTIHPWISTDISRLRQHLLKLALKETSSTLFLSQALRLVSETLATTAFFVDEQDAAHHTHTESFTVSAQNKSIGTLLIERSAYEQLAINRDEIQEVADIIGISLLSLQQNEELEALESESEEMLQYAPDVIFVLDPNGTVKMANQKAHELLGTGKETLKGQHICQLLAPLSMTELMRRGQSGEKFEVELTGSQGRRLASFNISQVSQGNSETQLLMVGRDITTERQAELALRRSERSTLMAQTIDYLLHEVNNPLGALLSSISTVLRKTERLERQLQAKQTPQVATIKLTAEADDWREDTHKILMQQHRILESARKSGTRINEAMKILRSANHKRTLGDTRMVDPAFELGLAISALEQEHRKIAISKSLDPLPVLEAPPLHLAEIFGALLKNAAEAVESTENGQPRILVIGGVKDLKVVITIEDSGPGFALAHREKVFMPFFTTKPLGHSIGLGLSMAMDMVKRVGGNIEIDASEHLGGALVRIFFPIR